MIGEKKVKVVPVLTVYMLESGNTAVNVHDSMLANQVNLHNLYANMFKAIANLYQKRQSSVVNPKIIKPIKN